MHDRFTFLKRDPRFLKSRWTHNLFIDKEFSKNIEDQSYFCAQIDDLTLPENCLSKQKGIFRVSCLDCVDDTDVAQYLICRKALVFMLKNLGELKRDYLDSKDQSHLEKIWLSNSDALARFYTGTISLNRTLQCGIFAKLLMYPYITISRSYLNCFTDQIRQDRLNIFMNQITDGNHNPLISAAARDVQEIRMQITEAINKREFSNKLNISTFFFLQTWILPQKINGAKDFLAALFWLIVYCIYRLFGFQSSDLVRKTMSLQNVNRK